VGPARDLLSDLMALQNRRHFWSTMFRATWAKHGFLQTKDKYNIVYFNKYIWDGSSS
jgi:hypothetical protein